MGFFVALQFLSVLPSPLPVICNPQVIGRSQAYFPLIGALLGAILVVIDIALRPFLSHEVVAALLLIALAVLTGAMHLDGLIDTCDGLFLQRARAERLAVMRDSRTGSFGVMGAITVMILKFSALVSMGSSTRLATLVLALTLSRWAMTYAIAAFPYARETGKGSMFQGHGRGPIAVATALALAVTLILWPGKGVMLFALVAVWTTLLGRFAVGRLGGLTGDSYGAIAETAETLVLISASFAWPGQ